MPLFDARNAVAPDSILCVSNDCRVSVRVAPQTLFCSPPLSNYQTGARGSMCDMARVRMSTCPDDDALIAFVTMLAQDGFSQEN